MDNTDDYYLALLVQELFFMRYLQSPALFWGIEAHGFQEDGG